MEQTANTQRDSNFGAFFNLLQNRVYLVNVFCLFLSLSFLSLSVTLMWWDFVYRTYWISFSRPWYVWLLYWIFDSCQNFTMPHHLILMTIHTFYFEEKEQKMIQRVHDLNVLEKNDNNNKNQKHVALNGWIIVLWTKCHESYTTLNLLSRGHMGMRAMVVLLSFYLNRLSKRIITRREKKMIESKYYVYKCLNVNLSKSSERRT